MKSNEPYPATKATRNRAFTIVELLVAVSIMTLIILVLYGMFDQVQKALRGNASQVDVLEGGRAAMELIRRELEQLTPSNTGGCTNFWVEVTSPPLTQSLVTTNSVRTNVLDSFYFLSFFNRSWSGVGYKIVPGTNLGSLYRFGATVHLSQFTSNKLSEGWRLFANTNDPANAAFFQRVTDGIVHFRVTAHDSLGQPMAWWRTNGLPDSVLMRNALFNGVLTGETAYVFRSNAVPAYVEVELAILEPHVLERYRSISNPLMARRFLDNNASAVHLFQQRIPIRAAPMIVVP
jgi:prepilin-type N-terminal cleavage/methylation domain-containing protein